MLRVLHIMLQSNYGPLVFSIYQYLWTFVKLYASFPALDPPSYLVGYVTGDTSVKLSWEVKSPSKNTVFELRWKSDSNESSMIFPGTTGTVTLNSLKVYTQYFFRVRRGFKNGTWGRFTRYTRVWTPEGGKNILTIC